MKFFKSSLFFLFFTTSFIQVLAQDSLFSAPQAIGEIPNPIWIEISGMAAGKEYPDRLYIHNDSGGENAVYVMSQEGEDLGKIVLEGVKNRDWEDLAVGPGPKNKSYVYVAEIGDNLARYKEVELYRFKESKNLPESVEPEKATFIYPKGPMDAEAIFVDPQSTRLYLISKRDSVNTLFEMPVEAFGSDETFTLKELGKLPFTSTVAADISQDGNQILIKTYFAVYHWDRKEGKSIEETLRRAPRQLLYTPEPQGEAIAFQADGNGYFTLSEERFEIKPVLYYYKKRD